MQRFFCRLLASMLLAAELIIMTWILTMSAHVIQIKEDKTGKIIDDGLAHAVGGMELPHTKRRTCRILRRLIRTKQIRT